MRSCVWSAAGDGKPAGMVLLHTSSHNWLDTTGTGKALETDLEDMAP
jgi:hypothetical protein